jgi:hypothetical protein
VSTSLAYIMATLSLRRIRSPGAMARGMSITQSRTALLCGWFSTRENQFAVANAVMTEIDCAGGIEVFRRRGP